jgi:hypothetical protein
MEKSTVMLSARVWGRRHDLLPRPLVESGRVQRDPILETGRMKYAVIPGPIAARGQVPVLDDQSFERWRDHVRPQAKEECYLQIPWRESFYIAINEARKADRPILLWAMNGHPLGCT